MPIEFSILALHTLVFWIITFALHYFRKKITILPLYGWLAALVALTHILSSSGPLLVNAFDFVFLVSSTAYFTPLLLGILLLYLFDGILAARKAIYLILLVSILQAASVALLALEVPGFTWIANEFSTYQNYFFSVIAMVMDIVAMAVIWETLSPLAKKSTYLVTPFTLFVVFTIDTLVFDTGVFAGSDAYWTIVQSNLIVRSILALIMGTVFSTYLEQSGYKEKDRAKPESVWSIISLDSIEQKTIQNLQEDIQKKDITNKKLEELRNKYALALEGINAGIWEWDITTNTQVWSTKFYTLLGYTKKEISASLDQFTAMLHPEDAPKVQSAIKKHFEENEPFLMEYRLKTKDGSYKWFIGSGQAEFNAEKKPVRMVGSIIDINEQKQLEEKLNRKISELEEMNQLMVGRELKMIELKESLQETPIG